MTDTNNDKKRKIVKSPKKIFSKKEIPSKGSHEENIRAFADSELRKKLQQESEAELKERTKDLGDLSKYETRYKTIIDGYVVERLSFDHPRESYQSIKISFEDNDFDFITDNTSKEVATENGKTKNIKGINIFISRQIKRAFGADSENQKEKIKSVLEKFFIPEKVINPDFFVSFD